MRIRKKDLQNTVHELSIQLSNIAQMDNINPVKIKEKNNYVKLLDKYKLFTKDLSKKRKLEIVSKLKLMNFNEAFLIEEIEILKAIKKFNSIINKKTIEIQDLVRAGKDVKINELIRKGVEPVEVKLPKDVRERLRIQEKKIKLIKTDTIETSNRIKYYSGQDYKFLIKDGFSEPYYISYDKLQKLRKEDKVVEFVLNKLESSVRDIYNKDKKIISQSEKKKWSAKLKVYDKLFKVLNHNIQIATNKQYNKKFVTRDEEGNIIKSDSEYPINMEMTGELIELYI
jgi:hypothetical protein